MEAALTGLALVGLLGYLVTIAAFPDDVPNLSHALFNLPIALTAVLCVRAGRRTGRRAGWNLLAVAVCCYLVGWMFALVAAPGIGTAVSVGDGFFIAFFLLTAASLLMQSRARIHSFTLNIGLDAAAVSAAFLSLSVAYLVPVLRATGDPSKTLVLLVYPLLDVLLLALLASGWLIVPRHDRTFTALTAGLLLMLLANAEYLREVAAGHIPPSPVLNLAFVAAITIIGLAAVHDRVVFPARRARSLVVLPVIASLGCASVVAASAVAHVTGAAVLVALAGLLISIVRLAVTVRQVADRAYLRHLSMTDQVTQLPNRVQLTAMIDSLLSRPTARLSVLVLTLSQLGRINQAHGLEAGDAVLRMTADRLRRRLQGSDRIIASSGNGEFALLIPGGGPADALATAQRLRTEIFSADFRLPGLSVATDVVIGTASAPADALTAGDLLTCASAARDRAERLRTGIEQFVLTDRIGMAERLVLMAELRRAFARGELVAHYQPQIWLASGAIVGAEALVRWQHPSRGLLAPDAFLPALHDAGLSGELVRLMLDATIVAADAAAAQDLELRFSLNVGADDLHDPAFLALVEDALASGQIRAGELALELTEDTVLSDPLRISRDLQRVQAAGVEVSIDDYGTGQASLTYLRDLHGNELKLDRSFVQAAADDARTSTIVQSTINLAHELQMTVVAEGVEDAETDRWLRRIGCEVGQGYWYGRPMPLPQLLELAEADRVEDLETG